MGCYCEDEAHCHRSVLRALLAERGALIAQALTIWSSITAAGCRYFGLLLVVLAACFAGATAHAEDDVLRVGSKRFTEAYILAEVLAQTAAPHARTQVRQGLGNTAIVFEALRSGNIDLYPDYLGTIDLEILRNPKPTSMEEIRTGLARVGPRHRCAARIQQRLCARDAGGRGEAARDREAVGPCRRIRN